MTLEQMARDCGFLVRDDGIICADDEDSDVRVGVTMRLREFAALVRAQALEEAAGVCEAQAADHDTPKSPIGTACAR